MLAKAQPMTIRSTCLIHSSLEISHFPSSHHRIPPGHSPGELSGCHNDVGNMKDYIVNCHGFSESNIDVLMDDGVNVSPTRANILAAYQKLVNESQPGDAVFCHYSGHGGKLRDDDGDEGKSVFAVVNSYFCDSS